MKPFLSNDEQVQLLTVHMNNGVDIYHTVSLLCKINEIKVETLAGLLGYSRSYLYQNLKGECKLCHELRERLAAILRIDPWNYVPMFDHDSPAPSITAVFKMHQSLGIPLTHSLNCLSLWQGVTINEFAARAGVRRNIIYNCLCGKTHPHSSVRKTMTDWIGVDPWGEPLSMTKTLGVQHGNS